MSDCYLFKVSPDSVLQKRIHINEADVYAVLMVVDVVDLLDVVD